MAEGSHRRMFERLGAHPTAVEGVDGVAFAVWAPNAERVSVVGDFNLWDGRRHPMRKRIEVGSWEIFLPGVGRGDRYKFELLPTSGGPPLLKADPVGFQHEAAAGDRLDRRRAAAATNGATRHGWNGGAADTQSPRRSPSTKCISARGGARTATAS